MSALNPQLTIKLDLDPAGVLKGATVASKNITGVGASIGQADKAGNKFSNTLKTMWRISGGIILAQVIRKVAHEMEALVGTAEDFDTAMRNVTSVTGQAGGDFQGLSDKVVNLALDPRIKDGPAALAQGLYTITSAGYSAQDSLVILKSASLAATAGMTTTAVASDVLISTLGAYGKTAKDATFVTNQLFQIVQISKYTFEDMASAMASVTPTAAALGIGLDEVGAAMATFGAKGVSAQTATVQMNAILTGLLKPTDAMTDQIHAFGYENGEAMIKALGFTKTMQMFAQVIGGSATKSEELFGDVKAVRGIMTLTNDDAVMLTANLVKMGDAQDGAGAMATALAEQMKSASFQIAVMHKDLEILVVMGFGLVAPYLVKALNYFNAFFSETLIGFRHFRDKGYGFFHALRASLKIEFEKMFGSDVTTKMLHFYDQFVKFFNEIKGVVETVLPPVEKVLGFIADNLDYIIPGIIGADLALRAFAVTMGIINVVGAIMDLTLSPLTLTLITIAAVGALLAIAWVHDWGGIQEKTHTAVAYIGKELNKFWNFIQPGIKVLKELGKYLGDVLHHRIEPKDLKGLPGWLQPIALILGRIIKTIRVFFLLWHDKGFSAAVNNMQFQIRALGRAISQFFSLLGMDKTAKNIKIMFYDLAKAFKDSITFFGDLIHGRWHKLWGDFARVLVDDLELAFAAIATVADLILESIPWGAIGHMFRLLGQWILKEMWHGISSLTGWILRQIWKGLYDQMFKQLLAVDKKILIAGRDIISWLWTGMASLGGWIVNEFWLFLTDIYNVNIAMFNAFYDAGHYVMMGIYDGMKDAWDWMKNELTKMWNDAPAWLRKLWVINSPSKVFSKIGFHAMEGLAKGFKDGHAIAIKTLSEVGNKLSQGSNITVNARVRPSGPVDMKYNQAGGSRLRALHLAAGSIIIKEASTPQKTAKALIQALDQWEAGSH